MSLDRKDNSIEKNRKKYVVIKKAEKEKEDMKKSVTKNMEEPTILGSGIKANSLVNEESSKESPFGVKEKNSPVKLDENESKETIDSFDRAIKEVNKEREIEDEKESKKNSSKDEKESKKNNSEDEKESKKNNSEDEKESKKNNSKDELESKKNNSEDEKESKKNNSEDEKESKKNSSKDELESKKNNSEDKLENNDFKTVDNLSTVKLSKKGEEQKKAGTDKEDSPNSKEDSSNIKNDIKNESKLNIKEDLNITEESNNKGNSNTMEDSDVKRKSKSNLNIKEEPSVKSNSGIKEESNSNIAKGAAAATGLGFMGALFSLSNKNEPKDEANKNESDSKAHSETNSNSKVNSDSNKKEPKNYSRVTVGGMVEEDSNPIISEKEKDDVQILNVPSFTTENTTGKKNPAENEPDKSLEPLGVPSFTDENTTGVYPKEESCKKIEPLSVPSFESDNRNATASSLERARNEPAKSLEPLNVPSFTDKKGIDKEKKPEELNPLNIPSFADESKNSGSKSTDNEDKSSSLNKHKTAAVAGAAATVGLAGAAGYAAASQKNSADQKSSKDIKNDESKKVASTSIPNTDAKNDESNKEEMSKMKSKGKDVEPMNVPSFTDKKGIDKEKNPEELNPLNVPGFTDQSESNKKIGKNEETSNKEEMGKTTSKGKEFEPMNVPNFADESKNSGSKSTDNEDKSSSLKKHKTAAVAGAAAATVGLAGAAGYAAASQKNSADQKSSKDVKNDESKKATSSEHSSALEQNFATENSSAEHSSTESTGKQVKIDENKNQEVTVPSEFTPVILYSPPAGSILHDLRARNSIRTEGFFYKKRDWFFCFWVEKYFTILNTGELIYFETDGYGEPMGHWKLSDATAFSPLCYEGWSHPFRFTFSLNGETVYFAFESEQEREYWLNTMKDISR